MDPDFTLMDDNARPQRARVTIEYLHTASIEGMDWPARTSDRNPIEHARDMLQTVISDSSNHANKSSRAPTATTRAVGSHPTEKHSKAT